MKKPKIGVDLDDTIIEFVMGFCAYHNRVYGGAFERHHFTTWHMHEVLGCSQEEGFRRVIEFYHSDDHQQLTAVPGALRALQVLSVDYDLVAITAREPERSERMIEVVRGHFGDLFSGTHFLGHQKKKGDFCVENGVSAMVDDGLHNAESVGGHGIRVYLMDQPWNQCDVLPPNTVRVFHWDDVVRFES